MRKPVSPTALLLALKDIAAAPPVAPSGPSGAEPVVARDDGAGRGDEASVDDDDATQSAKKDQQRSNTTFRISRDD